MCNTLKIANLVDILGFWNTACFLIVGSNFSFIPCVKRDFVGRLFGVCWVSVRRVFMYDVCRESIPAGGAASDSQTWFWFNDPLTITTRRLFCHSTQYGCYCTILYTHTHIFECDEKRTKLAAWWLLDPWPYLTWGSGDLVRGGWGWWGGWISPPYVLNFAAIKSVFADFFVELRGSPPPF